MRLPCVTEGAFQIVGGKQVACREWTFVLRERSLHSACADAILSRQKLLKAVVENQVAGHHSPPASLLPFQNRRIVHCVVSFHLNRAELKSELVEESRSCVGMAGGPSPIEYYEADRVNLGWQLMRVPVTTPTGCMNACGYMDSHSPDDGEAPLEAMLEEENLEDANLVEVEVKAEQERMAPRLPPPPQPSEPDASNNSRLLENVIERLQQQNTTLMEQNATLMQQNQAAMQGLEASRVNSENTQRQLMEILAVTRVKRIRLGSSLLDQVEKSRSCVGMAGGPSPIEYFEADRVNLGWQLMRVPVTTPTGCMNAYGYMDSHSPDDGEAPLEAMLEEENLEDANLVEVEVKAEQ
ncbi:uncharacterized protein HKW66_Vig0122820 [Vigna angularis]|uniref:Uncharacterized protein n=1 Tax=Phaseolus angularis TaxID=3914 RepID=A0A8T0JZX1_PHAAN|nr:uncharacterized protein HKW66_Vig0122820 [Vigna angularis]